MNTALIDSYYKNDKGLYKRLYHKHVTLYKEIKPFIYRDGDGYYTWNEKTSIYEKITERALIHDLNSVLHLDKPIRSRTECVEYYHRFRLYGSQNMPLDPPVEWIQFGHIYHDLRTGEKHPATPDYFSVNSLPFTPSKSKLTPVIDKLFTDWVGPDHVLLLKEMFAYCIYRKYSLQKIFALIGVGRNGKGECLRLLKRYLGQHNIAASNIHLLASNQFATYPLYRKLAVLISETDQKELKDTNLLKEFSGGDSIRYERKHYDSFTDDNYTKIIITSNNLPISNDHSVGFYRRWQIIDFNKNFNPQEAVKDISETVTDDELRALSSQLIDILQDLLNRGRFKNELNDDEARASYIRHSNPLQGFIETHCEETTQEQLYILFDDFVRAFNKYLSGRGIKTYSRRQIQLRLEKDLSGLQVSGMVYYVFGYCWSEDKIKELSVVQEEKV